MPTADAWVGFSLMSVCLLFQTIFKNDAAGTTKLDRQMLHDEFWKFVYLGSKCKRSRSRLRRSSNSTQQYCRCCPRKLRWVFPVVMPRRTGSASDIGFFPVSLPCVRLPLDDAFLRPTEKSLAQTHYNRKFVSIRHGDPRRRMDTRCHQQRWS